VGSWPNKKKIMSDLKSWGGGCYVFYFDETVIKLNWNLRVSVLPCHLGRNRDFTFAVHNITQRKKIMLTRVYQTQVKKTKTIIFVFKIASFTLLKVLKHKFRNIFIIFLSLTSYFRSLVSIFKRNAFTICSGSAKWNPFTITP
jgi:hypothetical protein